LSSQLHKIKGQVVRQPSPKKKLAKTRPKCKEKGEENVVYFADEIRF
jgi:hypothetical protein